jgi:hypothetical protein
MSLNLDPFGDPQLDEQYVSYLIDAHDAQTSRLARLWDYYRNPMLPVSPAASGNCPRWYVQAQEMGLPARITGRSRPGLDEPITDLRRKEVVIENDIAWRIHAAIDFLFGKPLIIRSLSPSKPLAQTIEQFVAALLEANGSEGFLQEMALFGAVYGFVDIALRIPADALATLPATTTPPPGLSSAGAAEPLAGRPGTSEPHGPKADPGAAEQDPAAAWSKTQLHRVVASARMITLETLEAPRVLPLLDENDYRRVRYWIQRFFKHPSRLEPAQRPWYALNRSRAPRPAAVEALEILGPAWWQRYEDRRLVDEGPNPLGRVPVVHVQNLALPGSYEGLGDVEPLIPLQDELNTRLSDRASRVTYQSFKMYLGKGIDDFLDRPVGPGQMWSTPNLSATIEEFGSDSGSPSEDAHIQQVRAALDKVSAIPPLAAGLISGNLGNLTSATALKVVLSGLLARTAKKRLTYGAGLGRIVELALEWADLMGILRTAPADRKIKVVWPDPLPTDEAEQLRNAQAKAALGVPAQQVLAELGYASADG